MKRLPSFLVIILALCVVFVGCHTKESEKSKTKALVSPEEKVELQVFIAASLKNAMEEIQADYTAFHPEVQITYNVDSSGTLQKQIEEGASCDLFFSAAMKQMNELNDGGYVLPDSIVKLLENKVVLIKPIGGKTAVTGFQDITKATNLALAGEDVPVGSYTREIFTKLGILEQVMAMEINEGANVTAVLMAVSEGSNEVGIVYATDANTFKDAVEVIEEAPVDALENPVIYPVALIKNAEASDAKVTAAKEFLAYLQSEEAIKFLKAYGFTEYNK